ncbi:MAG: glycosyltransferase family 4 protein [Sarcina sp.]
MKVTIDGRAANWYRGTGIGTYTYQLINNINQIDFYNLYNIYISKDSSLDLKFKKNFNLFYGLDQVKNNFWQDVAIPNKIKDNTADVYHIPQNGIGTNFLVDNPKVITLHDIIPLKLPETVSDTYLKIFNDQIYHILNNIDGIITVSNYSKLDICKNLNYPEEKIFVTHLAAEDQYIPLDRTYCKNYLKTNYNISDNYILYVGGFSPRKNILGLIEAFNMSKNKLPLDSKLIILGTKGKSFDLYKKRAEELNLEKDIIFPGFIKAEEMPIFYNSALMLVYPSFYEGFGLPPIEAMACGTPVIASNITSIPEVVSDGAFLINPYDSVAISEAIKEVYLNENLRKNLILKGFKQASSYNWKQTAFDTINIYKKISL